MSYGENDRPTGMPRRSPTGRIPKWAMDEAAGRPTEDTTWRESRLLDPVPPSRGGGPGDRDRWRRSGSSGMSTKYKVGLGVLAGVLVALLAVDLLDGSGGTPTEAVRPVAEGPAADTDSGVGTDTGPDAGPAAPAERDVTDVDGLRGTGYRFLAENTDGSPVAYDPCRPLRYVVNPRNAPVGGDRLVHEAVEATALAAGLSVVYEGTTDESAGRQREAYQPERYGEDWAPVLIAWPTEWDNPDFATQLLAGQGGSIPIQVEGRGQYVAGQIQLGAELFRRKLTAGQHDEARAIIKHEMGHVLGLDHVNDPEQLMFPEQQGRVDFGAGDLAGLAHLGSGPCGPEVHPGGG